jgi:hypothetical protein
MKSLTHESDRAEVLDRLARLQTDDRALWGKMNAHQMICHLTDSFKCATGDKSARFVGNAFQRTLVKWIALRSPLPWPKGVPTMPEMDQLRGGTPPTEFEADRRALVRMVERFTAADPDFTWHTHPIFSDMSVDEWHRWGYLHMDHHLRQFAR